MTYFLDRAPASTAPREYDPEVEIGLDQFRVVEFGTSRKTPMTTLVHTDDGRLFVGDFERSGLTVFDGAGRVIQELNTPHAPIALRRRDRELWVTDIGSVFPSDMPNGNLLVFRQGDTDYGSFEIRLTKLQRPTHSTYGDVNRLAGCELPLFEPPAVEALSQASRGLPRQINRTAHYALSAAALAKARTVDAEHMQHALDELRP